MHTTQDTPTAHRSGETPLTILALGMAMLLGALLWGALNQPARAEMVTQSGHLVAMTARGDNEEVLLMLDNRAEQLMIYKVSQTSSLDLIQTLDLPQLFQSARARRLGGE